MTDDSGVQLEHLVGPLIADAREAAGLKQGEAAAKAGIHPTTISSIENGRQGASFDMLVKLAALYGVPVASFFPDHELPEKLSDADALIGDINRDMKHLTPEYLDTLKLISGAMRQRVKADSKDNG